MERLERRKEQIRQYATRLELLSPGSQLNERRQAVADLAEKLHLRMEAILTQKKHSLELYAQQLEALSPLNKLSQGYAFVSGRKGRAIRSVSEVSQGELLQIHLLDGKITVEVKDVL